MTPTDTLTNAGNGPLLIRATCKVCGNGYLFESLQCMGIELGNTLQTCDDCLAEAERAREQEAEEARRRAIAASIDRILPPDLAATDPQHSAFNRDLWGVVRKWRPSPDSYWLLIIGPAGVCKTRSMALLAQNAMWAGRRVYWTTAHRLKAAAIDRHSSLTSVQSAARDHRDGVIRSQWLFVDDIGKANFTPAFESDFFELLDHRKTHRLATVFSSNVHPEDLAPELSPVNAEPIIGRLLDRSTIIDLRPRP